MKYIILLVLQLLQDDQGHLDVLYLHLHQDVPSHHLHPSFLVLPNNINN